MMQSSLSAFSSAGQSEEKTGTLHPVEAEIAACPKETCVNEFSPFTAMRPANRRGSSYSES